MFKAVQDNDLELVRIYLRMGVDPNYQHPECMALPLAESLRYNHLEIAELLLQNGADPVLTEMESGISSLALAKKSGKPKALELLQKYITT